MPYPAAVRRRGALRPPRGAGPARRRAPRRAARRARRRARAAHGEGPGRAVRDLHGVRRGGARRPRASTRPRRAPAGSPSPSWRRLPRSRWPLVAVAVLRGGEAPRRRRRRPAMLVRVDPRDERGGGRTRRRRPSRQAGRDARRHVDGRLPRRRAVALGDPRRPGGADHVQRRAARPRRAWATRSTSRPTAGVLRASSRATTPSPASARTASTCWHARWRRARASCGRPAARSSSGSAPTSGTAAQAASRASCPTRTRRRVENARVQFREMAVGAGSLWVLGDALDRRLWRLDARTGRAPGHDRARLPADARSPSRAAPHGSPTGCTTGWCRWTRATNRLLRAGQRRPRGGRHRRGRRRACGSLNTLDGTLSRVDPRDAARGGDDRRWAARRARSRSATARSGWRACALTARRIAGARRRRRGRRAASRRLRDGEPRPLRVGVVVDCVGVNRSLRGRRARRRRAAADRARRAAARRRRARRHRPRRRSPGGRSSSSAAAPRLFEFSTLTAEIRRLVEREHVDAVVAGGIGPDEIVLRDVAARYPRVVFLPVVHGPREVTLRAPRAERLPLRRRPRPGRRRAGHLRVPRRSAGGGRRS